MKFASAALAMATLAYAAPTAVSTEVEAVATIQEREAAAEADFFQDIRARQTVPATNCTQAGVHFIIVRGHGGPVTINGTSVPDPNPFNVLVGLRTMIPKQVPGSDVLGLRYDYNNADEVSGTETGTTLLSNYIKQYAASCPNSKIGLLGYSQGALVVMDALCGASEFPLWPTFPLDSKYAKNVIVAATYGDESRVPMQSWNYGTCPTSTGVGGFPRLNSAGCSAFAAGMRGYCDVGDNYCCTGGNNTGVAHAIYPQVYNQNLVNLIKSRVTATGGTL